MEDFIFKTSNSITSRDQYEDIIEKDRAELLLSQFRLRDNGVPVVVLISGKHGSGYSKVLNLLNEWMDTRFIETHVHQRETDEEAERPYFWKYWRTLPEKGATGLYLGGWYTEPYLQRLEEFISEKDFTNKIESINKFEELLTSDGVLLIKIWLDMTEEQQSEAIKNIPSRPDLAWRVGMDDWRNGFKERKKRKLVEKVLKKTHKTCSPWFVIDASNNFERDISVMHLLTQEFKKRLKNETNQCMIQKEFSPSKTDYLTELDLNKSLKRSKYSKLMSKFRDTIYHGAWRANHHKQSVVLVFEGADAAGKGGTIRRLIRALDARLYRVIQISAPTKIEKSKHYLWRFWMQIPRAGHITIYDRSWYGRVLVERVEGFATDEEWQRAYDEINEFEKELTDSGTKVLKFWLEISDEEQIKRFNKREKTDYKQYKLTDEDWRNREKRHLYHDAANDMFANTNTKYAPWIVVPAEDKKFARIKVLKEVDKILSSIGSINDE